MRSAIVLACIAIMLMANRSAIGQSHHTAVNYTVLLNNQRALIPLKGLNSKNIAYIRSIDERLAGFGEMLDRYAEIQHFDLPTDISAFNKLDENLKFFNTLIFAIQSSDIAHKRLLHFINTQAIGKQVVLAVFGEGSNLGELNFVHYPILWNEDLDTSTAQNTAMSIFGGLACTSRLTRSFSVKFALGAGHSTEQTRLTYADASAAGINKEALTKAVDGIVAEAIRERATPGAVVMVVKSGRVIFEKAYGHHTYSGNRPTRIGDLFDMASITKIAATTPVVMRLTERGLIDLDSTMGHYLLQAQNTNKKDTKLRDVMLHEAGFIPFIPFYRELKPDDLSKDSSSAYAVKVADNCYIRTNYYENVMWPAMLESKLNQSGSYVYSDISMYVMKEVAEHQTGIPIQEYVQTEFYRPLGMKTAGYDPRERFDRDRTVPTEDDQVFRGTLLQGYVHDQGAAMAGGIAGHAGLFATANDLAIYSQLLLNRGEYGGERYFKPETVDLFTSNQSRTSRRGLGFDRKDPDASKKYPSAWASEATFGHTGYTGTCIWIDPKEQLAYIFLSNRVHPEVSTKLISLNIRGRIQDAVYAAISASRKP